MQEQPKEFKIVFLPDKDFEIIKSAIKEDLLEIDIPLKESGVKNFIIKETNSIFIHNDARNYITTKMKKGESLT